MNAAQHRMLGRLLVPRLIDHETGDAIVACDGLDAPIRSEIADRSRQTLATRRYELSNRADEDSGFRCAKSAPVWPDAGLWLAQLK
jgi:hypothetical protein